MAATPNAIFLSYSAHDEAAAGRICTALRAAGLDVWFVSEDPDPILLVLKDDPHYDELINRPPRL